MVTLSEIKLALKIDYSTDDSEILRLRSVAVDFIESYTGLILELKEVTQYLPSFNQWPLQYQPLISVEGVFYTNANDERIEVSEFYIKKSKSPTMYIGFNDPPTLPENEEVELVYLAGFQQVPPQINHAIIALIGHFYNHPEATSIVNLSTVPLSATFILDQIRIKGSLS